MCLTRPDPLDTNITSLIVAASAKNGAIDQGKLKRYRILFEQYHFTQEQFEALKQNSTSIQFRSIINHPICLELLQDSSGTEFSNEGLQFYLQTKLYQETNDSNNRANLRSKIIDLYVRPGATNQINLSGKSRTMLIESDKANSTDTTLFKRAQKEIFDLMQADVFVRFPETPQFLLCAILLSKQQNNSAAANDEKSKSTRVY